MQLTKKKLLAGLIIAVLAAMMICMIPTSQTSAANAPESVNTFTFTDEGITASDAEGSGFEIDGTSLKITESGVYTVTGSCDEGSVTVKKGTTDVTLVLEDLELSSSTTAPVSCNKGTETTIYVAGTVTLTDNEDIANEESDDFEGAAIKVKSEDATLVITGPGILNLNGNAKNGIKGAETSVITIEDSTVNIMAANDGIHAGDELNITGGTVNVTAEDDGIKAEYTVNISGGEVNVLESGEGIEGASVNISGGTVNVNVSDDGINAANSDLTGYDFELNITGGTVYIDADGDGLDSNGTINVDGGVTVVYGSVNNGNSALDSVSGINYVSGTLFAAGMSGMAESPAGDNVVVFGSMAGGPGMMPQMNGQTGEMPQMNGQTGEMPQMNGGFGGTAAGSYTIAAGDKISITDSEGNVLFTSTAAKTANSVIFASDDVVSGETYTLLVNGSEAASAAAGQTAVQGFGQPGAFGAQQGTFGQPPEMNGQMPEMNGEMPEMNGQMPGMNGQPPEMNGQMPGMNGQPPAMNGEQSQMPPGGERPPMRPGMNAQQSGITADKTAE